MRFLILLLLCSCADIMPAVTSDATPVEDATSDVDSVMMDAHEGAVDASAPDAIPPSEASWPCDIVQTDTWYTAENVPSGRFIFHSALVDFHGDVAYFACNRAGSGPSCAPGGAYPCVVTDGPQMRCQETGLTDSDIGILAYCDHSSEEYRDGAWVPIRTSTATHVEMRR
jgi:hypothetical protein